MVKWSLKGVRYLSLHSAHAHTLWIDSLVSEPKAGVNMLDVTHRVTILDVRCSHPIHLLLHTRIQLFLKDQTGENGVRPVLVFQAAMRTPSGLYLG